MTLFGLDIILDEQGQFRLIEINGSRSGMEGFRRIYGDNRVQEQVAVMLQERHGKVTVNTGMYAKLKPRNGPIQFAITCLAGGGVLYAEKVPKPEPVLLTEKAHLAWLSESTHGKGMAWPFEVYKGQESAVLNCSNDVVPHPVVNPYVAEMAAENKLFTWLLLKGTQIQAHMPYTTVFGYGMGSPRELEHLLQYGNAFVRKPILGSQGRGIVVLDREQLEEYKSQFGSVSRKSEVLLEDLVHDSNYSFEQGLSIIQPLVCSRRKLNGRKQYAVVRAIVCNETFVDAYERVSRCVPVNLAKGAQARPFQDERMPAFCESVVKTLLEQSSRYAPDCKKELYETYLSDADKPMADPIQKFAEVLEKISYLLTRF